MSKNGHKNGNGAAEKPLSNGRRSNGQFAEGNPGGPGYPLAGRVAELRGTLLTALQPADVVQAVGILRTVMADPQCKPGERVMAAKEILDRAIGKPEQSHDHKSGGRSFYKVLLGVNDDDL